MIETSEFPALGSLSSTYASQAQPTQPGSTSTSQHHQQQMYLQGAPGLAPPPPPGIGTSPSQHLNGLPNDQARDDFPSLNTGEGKDRVGVGFAFQPLSRPSECDLAPVHHPIFLDNPLVHCRFFPSLYTAKPRYLPICGTNSLNLHLPLSTATLTLLPQLRRQIRLYQHPALGLWNHGEGIARITTTDCPSPLSVPFNNYWYHRWTSGD